MFNHLTPDRSLIYYKTIMRLKFSSHHLPRFLLIWIATVPQATGPVGRCIGGAGSQTNGFQAKNGIFLVLTFLGAHTYVCHAPGCTVVLFLSSIYWLSVRGGGGLSGKLIFLIFDEAPFMGHEPLGVPDTL